MQLTKGQKDALVRRVMQIIGEKKEAKRKELIKTYKPSKEAQEVLERAKKVIKARDAYIKIAKECGFKFDSYSIEIPVLDGSKYINHNRGTYEDFVESVRESELAKMYNEVFKYPDQYEVYDELELLNLDKSFDLNAFLAKYKNL